MEEKEVEEIERMMGRIEKLSSISVAEWELLMARVYELYAIVESPVEKAYLQNAKKELRKFRQEDIRDTERRRN